MVRSSRLLVAAALTIGWLVAAGGQAVADCPGPTVAEHAAAETDWRATLTVTGTSSGHGCHGTASLPAGEGAGNRGRPVAQVAPEPDAERAPDADEQDDGDGGWSGWVWVVVPAVGLAAAGIVAARLMGSRSSGHASIVKL